MEIVALPQLKLIEDGGAYELARERYDRVTEIIGTVLPPYLVPWAEKVGRQAILDMWEAELPTTPPSYDQAKAWIKNHGLDCNSQKLAGGDRGTAIHTCLERYVKHDEIPNRLDVAEEHAPFVQSLAGFLAAYRPELSASEITVYHPEGFAGTIDAYGMIASQPGEAKHEELTGKKVLLDTKTNKEARVYFPQHHYQLAGYRLAWDELGLPKVDNEIIVAIGPAENGHGRYRVEVNHVVAEEFLALVGAYRSLVRAKDSKKKGRK